MPVVYLFILSAYVTAASVAQKNAARALALFDDPKVVGALAEALDYNDQDVETVARETLIRNLPRLKASDGEYLNSDQRKCLHKVILKPDKDIKLGMAILTALDQVGDDRDVLAVRRLAEGEAATANQKKLGDGALDILPDFEERSERAKAAQILLRAVSAPAS